MAGMRRTIENRNSLVADLAESLLDWRGIDGRDFEGQATFSGVVATRLNAEST